MQSVSVCVVSICGALHLRRCLDALAMQVDVPPFETVVVYDPHLKDVPPLAAEYQRVRMVANEGLRTPLELASRAVKESTGDLVLLTEDHCVPKPDWVKCLCDAQQPDRAAVGGTVECDRDASTVDWALYFVDFFRYATPSPGGPAPSLTVCNVAYWRSHLEQTRHVWNGIFHETAVNENLRSRFGPLWLVPHAVVRMRRHVRLLDAVYERYAFGRLFGCTRLQFAGRMRQVYYTLLSPLLPPLLLGRMSRAALLRRRLWKPFLRAFPVQLLLVLSWSWGEWLGYLTQRRPESLLAAQEILE